MDSFALFYSILRLRCAFVRSLLYVERASFELVISRLMLDRTREKNLITLALSAYHSNQNSYMSTPSDNPSGYENTRVMNANRVEQFRNVSYLLIHGTADDNVHFQNAMHLTTALIERQIPFETQVYPDKNHAISGPSTRFHLYSKITDFFLHKCQRKEGKPPPPPLRRRRVKRSVGDDDDDDVVEDEDDEYKEEEEYGDDQMWKFDHQPTCRSKDLADCL